ncbi:CBS domain-containing protein [Rubrimonas cliftonensis]|uniref:CBS domain-containing protein n=1 Tax=Rubrimonas cliftonensis TaxID=89524 RepID=A0A1H4A2H5_9RHOB|nr:CBS domain-containing protein [Rubrimonas cliftonensis]SEA29674.1 CBS domain-containing protein [Rubrimonas cliftonensis]
MKITELPEFRTRDALLTARADETVAHAARRMSEKNYGSIVVVDEAGRLGGIFTERDLLRRVVAEGRDPASLTLGEAMTGDVKTARVDEEVLTALGRMSNGRFRHMPLVDADGALQGMVSQGDFVAYTWPELLQRAKENAKAVVGSQYWQVLLIIVAVLVWTLLVQIVA